MKKSFFILSAFVLSVGMLTACGSKEETTEVKPKEIVTEIVTTPVEYIDEGNEDAVEKEEAVAVEPNETDSLVEEQSIAAPTPEEKENEVKIADGEAAIQHLKASLADGMNEDISYGTNGTLETDDKGSYFTIRLVSISMRLAGGTGTLDTYKVYQDGTYKGH